MAEDGEAWKGEDDDSAHAGWGVFSTFFGAPATAEQKAKYAAQLARARALGDLVWPSVKVYDPAALCAMCGSPKHRVIYCGEPSAFGEACAKHAGTHAHLDVTCKHCGYGYVTRPLTEIP